MKAPTALIESLDRKWDEVEASVLADWLEEQLFHAHAKLLRKKPTKQHRMVIRSLRVLFGSTELKQFGFGPDWKLDWLPGHDAPLWPSSIPTREEFLGLPSVTIEPGETVELRVAPRTLFFVHRLVMSTQISPAVNITSFRINQMEQLVGIVPGALFDDREIRFDTGAQVNQEIAIGVQNVTSRAIEFTAALSGSSHPREQRF